VPHGLNGGKEMSTLHFGGQFNCWLFVERSGAH